MTDNPWSPPPACPRCRDRRHVARSSRARPDDVVPCPNCGSMDPDEYDRFRRAAWARSQTPPAICELDLSDAELARFRQLRAENPDVAKATVLSWIEGARYSPAKDPAFLAECDAALASWRARRDAEYDAYRYTHPYSKGDGRIGREKDRFGRIFETKEGRLTGEGPERVGATPKTASLPAQRPETARQSPTASPDVPYPSENAVPAERRGTSPEGDKTVHFEKSIDRLNPPSEPEPTFGAVLDRLDAGLEDAPPW